MPRRKKSEIEKKIDKNLKKIKKRLSPPEQTRESKKTVAFTEKETSVYTPLSSLSLSQIRDLIKKSHWIEDCINIIVDEVIKYPLITEPEDPEIDTFLKYCNETKPFLLLRKQYLKDMLRYGNGCLVIEYKKGKPNRLKTVPGYTLRVTDKEPPTYKFVDIKDKYEFLKDENGNEIELSDKEVIHFAIDLDSDLTTALSPIERIYEQTLTDKYLAERLREFTEKGLIKPTFITTGNERENITSEDMKKFLNFVDNLVAEGHKVVGINRYLVLRDIPSLSASEIIELERFLGLVIANIYKVPPFMLNLVEDVGSLNAREQKARFLENVILPILEYEASLFTLKLAIKGFKRDPGSVQITSPIISTRLNWERARIARLLVGADQPILTVNEARKLFFNLPPIEEVLEREKEEESLDKE